MTSLAPIGISTYTRLSHLKKTLSFLVQNTLSKYSEVYVFSDGAKAGDEEKVMKLREYVMTVKGFKKLHLVERKENNRIFNNRGGIKQLLDEYGKVIFIEEDIITAPGFLTFMNQNLDYYKDNDNVISITGYCPPINAAQFCLSDVFALKRFSGWGFGTWKHKFDPFGMDIRSHGIESFLKDKKAISAFKENGDDLYNMLLMDYEGRLDALDVKLMFYEYKYNKFTLYPKISLVKNIGFDGSGLHCGKTPKFDVDLWQKQDHFSLDPDIGEIQEIKIANKNFRRVGIRRKIETLFIKIGLSRILDRVKRKKRK